MSASELTALRFEPRGLELAKWAGLAAMLAEHVAVYGFGSDSQGVQWVGSLALPLFAYAFAAGAAASGASAERVVRLLAWACVAEFFARAVRGSEGDWNVLFTFGLAAVALYGLERARIGRRVESAALIGAVVVAGWGVEYGHVGVLLVVSAHEAFRRGGVGPVVLVGAALVMLSPLNGNPGALLAPVALVAVNRLPELPRVQGLFYYAYVGQWVLLAIAV